ncbi:MAG: hypothetical protein ABI306_00070 [Caulobacteraceae bacterium]
MDVTAFGAGATRRRLLAMLPVAVVASGGAVWGRSAALAVESPLVGKEAGLFVFKAISDTWRRPDGFVIALYQSRKRWAFLNILSAYSDIYTVRHGAPPGVLHMLCAAQVILPPMCDFRTMYYWNGGQRSGLDPAMYSIIWPKARLIELERRGVQTAPRRRPPAAVSV